LVKVKRGPEKKGGKTKGSTGEPPRKGKGNVSRGEKIRERKTGESAGMDKPARQLIVRERLYKRRERIGKAPRYLVVRTGGQAGEEANGSTRWRRCLDKKREKSSFYERSAKRNGRRGATREKGVEVGDYMRKKGMRLRKNLSGNRGGGKRKGREGSSNHDHEKGLV